MKMVAKKVGTKPYMYLLNEKRGRTWKRDHWVNEINWSVHCYLIKGWFLKQYTKYKYFTKCQIALKKTPFTGGRFKRRTHINKSL
jgi:hypothetical protein